MKEIDFLPDWYRTGQKRQVNYRTQCIVLSGVFLVMMVWSLATTRSISNVKAGLAQMTTQLDEAERASAELEVIKTELNGLGSKIQSIGQIDSKIDVASVLAEISALIGEMVVLSKIEFIAEKPEQGRDTKPSTRPIAVVRVAQAQLGKKSDLPLGHVRFKVSIAGVASDAGDVAAFIGRLEESPYFRQVVLSFSRNGQVGNENAAILRDMDVPRQAEDSKGRFGATGEKLQVSEFQINCYVGNYREL
jgi:hypothetical protein